MRCRISKRFPGRALICAARFRFLPASNTWSGLMTMRSTAIFSRGPYIDMVMPTLTDPSVAPPGKHILSCFVQYAPYKLRPGLNWDDQKEAFGDNVINTIAEYAPNIRDIILHKQVITPLELEREWGLSEGNIFQGELSLEQLFFLRPAPGYARFRTPIQNLYMCGSATHPGG